jgi:hypothetical protein
MISQVNGICVRGLKSPKYQYEPRDNRKEKVNIVVDPKRVLFPVQGSLIVILPQRFPTIEAIVSAMIIIRIPAIAKYS